MATKGNDKAQPGRSAGSSRAAPRTQDAAPAESETTLPGLPAVSVADGDRVALLERELASVRADSTQALAAAEAQLGAAAKRIEQVDEIRRQSMPPPPAELTDAKARATKLAAELASLRDERDQLASRLDAVQIDLDSARVQGATHAAAMVARDARLAMLERASQSETALRDARDELQIRLDAAGKNLEALQVRLDAAMNAREGAERELSTTQDALSTTRSELSAARAEQRLTLESGEGLRGVLEQRDAALAGLRAEQEELRAAAAQLRAEVDEERAAARAREEKIIHDVRERETRMIAEVQSREARLVEMAQTREKQLLAEAEAQLQALARDKNPLTERVAVLQKALEESREREATLDAEARVRSNDVSESEGATEREQQLEEQLENARRDARVARDALEDVREEKQRVEVKLADLQGTIDSLGMERSALRAEAGQARAQLESLHAVEQRAHQLLQELEEARRENEFLGQEVARATASGAVREEAAKTDEQGAPIVTPIPSPAVPPAPKSSSRRRRS